MAMPRTIDVTTSWVASVLRFGAGMYAVHAGTRRPEQPLELYEFEGCPFCRKVREALTMLDLPVVVYPCPKGGEVYRPKVVKEGGREMFPYLVDPNAGIGMYESSDIIRYLYDNYGSRSAPWWLHSDISVPLGSLASVVRTPGGVYRRASVAPVEPLQLYSFEASPYCRIAREALCELELPYRLINVGKRSAARAAFRERSGRMMVPWLHDPNTDTDMFESGDIAAYLRRTYGRAS